MTKCCVCGAEIDDIWIDDYSDEFNFGDFQRCGTCMEVL